MGFSYTRQNIISFLTKSIGYLGRYLSHSRYKEVNIYCSALQAISLLHNAIQHFQKCSTVKGLNSVGLLYTRILRTNVTEKIVITTHISDECCTECPSDNFREK